MLMKDSTAVSNQWCICLSHRYSITDHSRAVGMSYC